jgi:hypothetical protein
MPGKQKISETSTAGIAPVASGQNIIRPQFSGAIKVNFGGSEFSNDLKAMYGGAMKRSPEDIKAESESADYLKEEELTPEEKADETVSSAKQKQAEAKQALNDKIKQIKDDEKEKKEQAREQIRAAQDKYKNTIITTGSQIVAANKGANAEVPDTLEEGDVMLFNFGLTESKVNAAGNYTKPGMRKKLFKKIVAGTKGGDPGEWSARKAQLLAKEYKKAGGGYKN